MADAEELNGSELGTLEHWEQVYASEVSNFEDFGDVGEIWFGKSNAEKLIRCIEGLKVPKTDPIVDLGCGNGWSLLRLFQAGYENLLGVDYAPKAVELAKAVLKARGVSGVRVEVCDILGDLEAPLAPGSFRLVLDKGTYDAISLNPEDRLAHRRKYARNVGKILMDSGLLLISSCNWTSEELLQHFQDFEVLQVLETPGIQFGGKQGRAVTNVVFRKINK